MKQDNLDQADAMNDETNLFRLQAEVERLPRETNVSIRDSRTEPVAMFNALAEDFDAIQLATEIWRIGVAAMSAAVGRANAQQSEQLFDRLLKDVRGALKENLDSQHRELRGALQEWIDPSTGRLQEQLGHITKDDGDLSRLLKEHLGADSSTLARTLSEMVGENSPIAKLLDTDSSNGLFAQLQDTLNDTLTNHDEAVAKALDPLNKSGPVSRFMTQLEKTLKNNEQDREQQMKTMTAALDANDEHSAISRLIRETAEARTQLIGAIDPTLPDSPMNRMRTQLQELLADMATTMDDKFEQMQDKNTAFQTDVIERLTQLSTRRSERDSSAKGGGEFEDDVVEFLQDLLVDQLVLVEQTGDTVGMKPNCKVGDVVITHLPGHVLEGTSVVVEAKRDASYTMSKAMQELDVALENRDAEVGIFVFETSRAPEDLKGLRRVDNKILVRWDPNDPSYDHYLMAASYIALGLIRGNDSSHAEDREAITKIVGRLEMEIKRIGDMETWSGNIIRDGRKIEDALTTMRKKITIATREADATLKSLGLERQNPSDLNF